MEKLNLNRISLCACILAYLLTVCAAVDTLTVNQTIKDTGDTIVSAGDTFELGFFSPNNSSDRYLGIWYKRISTGAVVWVANKGAPVKDLSGVFRLRSDGKLVLSNGSDTVVWASDSVDSSSVYPVAQLLDTGNLVVTDARGVDQDNIIWQSNPSYDACVRSGICGPYGTCSNNKYPLCGCLRGFKPSRPNEWEVADWSGGCERTSLLNCGSRDGFVKISGMKLPKASSSWYNESMTLAECEMICTINCSCTAYANLDVQSGCSLWFGNLEDLRENSGGRELYVRLGASELQSKDGPFINS